MALYQTANNQSTATMEEARAVISLFRAAAGMQKTDNLACHPVVADALVRVREALRLPRRGRGQRWNRWKPPASAPP